MQRAKRRDSHTEEWCRPALTSLRGFSAHPPGRGGWGLVAEAQASDVRSQGEDGGWLHEHSLKGASVPQLARRESGKSLDMPKKQETIVLGCVRRGDSENCLNKLQRWVGAMATSADTRDRHERLRLLLQPPRSLCTSTGHYPHLHFREPVQPPLPGSRDPGTTSPEEHTVCLRLLQRHEGLCHCTLTPHSIPHPPPGLSEAEQPNQLLY